MSSEAWVESTQLDDHVAWILDQLEERGAAVSALLVGDVCADLICYSFGPTSGPPVVSPPTFQRARALGLTIEIDHYQADLDHEPSSP